MRGAREKMAQIGRYDSRIPFSMPTFVRTDRINSPLDFFPMGGGDITLVFDNSGPRAFPPEYRAFLQSVFDQAKPALNATFGSPAQSGNVFVRNYDADIGDRDAVAGGYFIPSNGSGQMEIAFPVYNQPEATAVNFIHTLLLAYQGQNPYTYDAFEEGLVRASTMKVVRTPGAMSVNLDPDLLDAALENLYDVGPWYDWYNQRGLSGPQFIAPNLKNAPLPPGGSTGGLYLLRYMMSGSAWQKVLAEHPGFIAAFNQGFYANPSIAGDITALVQLGQQTLDTLRPGDATIEGLSFSDWFKRQFILQTTLSAGTKLVLQPIPLDPQSGSDDYGVFDIWIHFFETRPNGDEILLSGTSFPIFWEPSFNRFSTSAQDDRVSIAGAFGDVAPNFPNQFNNPYRVAVDIPVQDQLTRVYLPAGAIATATNPTPNDFYGTVVGSGIGGSVTGRVQVFNGANLLAETPVRNSAFGTRINTSTFLGTRSLTVKLIKTVNGGDQEILSRRVNKGPGPLALDLRVNGDVVYNPGAGLPKGMSTFGVPLDPFSSDVPALLGLTPQTTLVARYNPAKARYDLFPDVEEFKQGHGYFIRLPAATPIAIEGRISLGTSMAVALRPGWNMISNPLLENVSTTQVRVIKGSDFPKAFAAALGNELGLDFFEFLPGPNDPSTGAPETGTMSAATSFQVGKAYFVRVLAPEGAVLLFEPQDTRSVQSFAAQQPQAGPNGAEWQVQMTLSDGRTTAKSYIAQTTTATRGFDRREDSALPPGIGGLQLWSENGDLLYRDVRNLSQPETYRVRLDGLRRGFNHTVTFSRERGTIPQVTVYDPARRTRRQVNTQGGSYTFTAWSTSEVLEISVLGGGR